MIGREQLERLGRSLLDLGARRLAALAVVGLTVFAAVGLGSYYLSRPQFETLYSGLSAQDVGRIAFVGDGPGVQVVDAEELGHGSHSSGHRLFPLWP